MCKAQEVFVTRVFDEHRMIDEVTDDYRGRQHQWFDGFYILRKCSNVILKSTQNSEFQAK